MYPNLTKENKIAGLEFADLLAFFAAYLLIFLFSKFLIFNLALLAALYGLLLFYKKGKAPRYTQNLLRYLIRPSHYRQSHEVSA